MPIISKETWDKFTQEEKEKLQNEYKKLKEEPSLVYASEYAEKCNWLEYYFGRENLQPQLTYEDVAMELFKDSALQADFYKSEYAFDTYPLNCISEKQAEKLLAINKLLNVAKFLNKDWKPDEGNVDEFWVLGICKYNDKIEPICVGNNDFRTEIVYFRTDELAKQAIQILEEATVRLALTTEY